MREGYGGAGEDERASDPPRRRARIVRLFVEPARAYDELHCEEQDGGEHEADEGAEQQRLADVQRLRPVHARGALRSRRQELVGETHAHDGTDQRVTGTVGNAHRPGAEIPDDGGDQQGEDHRVTGSASNLQNEIDGQERDDAVGNRAGGCQHAQEVEHARPYNRDDRRHGVGVDHRRHGVGRVVKAVHELEAQRNQECDAEQPEDTQRQRLVHAFDIPQKAIRGVARAADQEQDKYERGAGARPCVEPRPSRPCNG